MKYLIDTNICIYLMNKKPKELIEKLKSLDIGEVGVSSVTVSELFYGAYKSGRIERNLQRLGEFLAPFEIVPYDESAARVYGEIRSQLEREGKVIGPLDLLIAASALSRNLILVTNNEKEFTRIGSLTVENWVGSRH